MEGEVGDDPPTPLAGGPGIRLVPPGVPLGWPMCSVSVTRAGQQRTAHAFFMILESSVQSRSLEKRLGGQGGQVMSQLFQSSLGNRGHFYHDRRVLGQVEQVGKTLGGG